MKFFTDYEVKDDVKKACTDAQNEMIDNLSKLSEDVDTLSMDSIKVLLPDKFSSILGIGIDDSDSESIKLMMKFLKMYNEMIKLLKISSVVVAEQCAQINSMEKTLLEMKKKIDKM